MQATKAAQIMRNYLIAVEVHYGVKAAERTEICVTGDGMFLIRHAGHRPQDPGTVYSPEAVNAEIINLLKDITLNLGINEPPG